MAKYAFSEHKACSRVLNSFAVSESNTPATHISVTKKGSSRGLHVHFYYYFHVNNGGIICIKISAHFLKAL